MLTLEDIYHPEKKLDFEGKSSHSRLWLDDEHYLESNINSATLDCQRVHARTGSSEPFYDAQTMRSALGKLPDVTEDDFRKLAELSDERISPDRTATLIQHGSNLFYYRLGAESADLVAENIDVEAGADFSPDGNLIGYIKNNNIHVVDLATRSERPLTVEGSDDVFIGRLDWVYQEELYVRGNFRAYWWSPDSAHIAFLWLDESQVEGRPMVDHTSSEQPVVVRYPRAGDPNPKVRLGVVDATGGPIRWMDTSSYASIEHLIGRVAWTPNGKWIVYQVQNREQTWLDLVMADPATGQARTLFRESSEAWVGITDNPCWLRDDSFLWLSERSGWRHIYNYSKDYKIARAVTSGEWNVDKLHGVDEKRDWIYFSGTEHSPIASHAYRIRADGSGLERLPLQEGTHQTMFSPAFSYFIDSWSDLASPGDVRLYEKEGNEVRVIERKSTAAIDAREWGTTQFVRVPTKDGFTLEALMIKPPDFHPDRKYPILCHVYGGPMAPKVRNAWGGTTFAWHQMLAERGCIVWICDNRTASGKGVISAWPLYRNFGELELEDVEDGLTWLKSQRYVDPDRIGIWGWSFGGYLTTYAMTHSTSFKMGIAGAPVTDWALYDSIYTERYMGMPTENPEGYRKSSVLEAASNLHGKLLIVHGTMDDNVHLEHSMQLVYALQEADKDFQLMLYPRSRHKIDTPGQLYHMQSLMTDFVIENL